MFSLKDHLYQRKMKRRIALANEVSYTIKELQAIQNDINKYNINTSRAELIESIGIRLSSIAHLAK